MQEQTIMLKISVKRPKLFKFCMFLKKFHVDPRKLLKYALKIEERAD